MSVIDLRSSPDSFSSNLGQKTLEAIKCLKPSGEKSFEKLTAVLLSQLVGIPVRLCKAGYQAGIDALAELPFAIEDKRYQKDRPKERDLEGGLASAARRYPELQLWVLMATVELDPGTREALHKTGGDLGLGVLILDGAATQPYLPGIPIVAALCATDIDATIKVISDKKWLDSRRAVAMPPVAEVEADLKKVQELSGFPKWVSQLRVDLSELPVWRLIIERQNRRLLQLITNGARENFGTAFNPAAVVPRTAKGEINKWLDLAIKSSDPEIAVILGDRYDGKTWCVFDWLSANLATLPLPVFLIGSNRGIDSSKSLKTHILEDVKRSLGQFERHAEAVINRQRDLKAGATPWCLVILDGLNEYLPNFDKCLGHIAYASGRTDLDSRPCAVLTTIRRQSWEEWGDQIQSRKQTIEIGPYDDTEFEAALQLHRLPENYVDSLPATAHSMVRRPRYFGLVVDHQAQLGAYESVTPDVLNWLDACDKMARSKPALGSDWGAEQYQEVLKNLAAHTVERGSFNLTEMHSKLGSLASNISAAIADLRSEGVLEKIGTRFRPRSDRLALGMGLWILDQVSEVMETKGDVTEYIRNSLAPDPEAEEKIAWLRAATIVALLYEPALPSDIIDNFVNEWLRSHNLSPQDFQEIKAVRLLLLPSLLRLAPKTWSSEEGEPRLQELSRMVFVDALPSRQAVISEAVREWFRLVPRAGSGSFQQLKEKDDPAALIQSQVNLPELTALGLQLGGDQGLLSLQRVGLFLLKKVPELASPLDLLALLTVKSIALDDLGDGERFIIRQVLSKTDAMWFVGEVGKVLGHLPGRWRNSLYCLMIHAEREDLVSLAETIKPPVDPQWEFWERGRIKNRDQYDEVYSLPFVEEDDPAHFIREVGELVCNPGLPRLCEDRLATIRKVIAATFSNVELGTSLGQTIEDADFERMLPVMAAWTPDIGGDVMRRQILKLPENISKKPLWWLLELRRHAVLAEGSVRAALIEALSSCRPDSTDGQVGIGAVLLTLFPGMDQSERIEALLQHPLKDLEWTELYHCVAQLLDGEGKTYLLKRLQSETDPLQIRRLYHLLGSINVVPLTEGDMKLLANKITHGNEADQLAALRLAAVADVKTLTLELLFPFAADQNEPRSLLSDYASWLLINGDALKTATYAEVSRLRPRWRALAATKRQDFCQIFLKEIELALNPDISFSQVVPQTPIHIEMNEDNALPNFWYGLSPEIWSSTVQYRRSETTTGGVAWLRNDTPQEVAEVFEGAGAAAERFQKLQKEIRERFIVCCKENETCWAFEQFPYALVKQLYEQERPRFEQWLTWLLADKARAKNWWGGLLMPIVQVMLRSGDSRTKELWELVSPFQRARNSVGSQFVIDGIHWGFHELSAANVDDGLAVTLLKDLVHQAFSDQELFHIALGARIQEQKRLAKIIREFLEYPDAEVRARAVKIAGLLKGMDQAISTVEQTDSSLWVRKVAKDALKTQQLEDWAQHWFNIFLTEPRTEVRWGAGQLFLSCVDACFQVWAWPTLDQLNLPTRVRGEAILLLKEAQKLSKKREQKLQDSFLLHNINDLKAVCEPWHPAVDWEQLASV
jgi:hypothetical protein